MVNLVTSNEEETMQDPITVLELAEHRLGHEASTGADFEEAGLTMMGGCQVCHATLAAYNAYPCKSGYWRCEDHIGDQGYPTAAEANTDIFGVAA
jgi:hypothetical protein